jgi:hypothetical protein
MSVCTLVFKIKVIILKRDIKTKPYFCELLTRGHAFFEERLLLIILQLRFYLESKKILINVINKK